MQDIVDEVKKDERVTYITDFPGDRHLLQVPVAELEVHPELSEIRDKAPKDISLLSASMQTTGKDSIYPACLYVALADDRLHYFIADGHQRVRAARDSGFEEITCQWISRWRTPADAMRDCVSLGFARFKMSDADVMSTLSTGVLSNNDVARLTGMKESKVVRLAKVARQEWLKDLVAEDVLGYSVASRLLDACGKNADKVYALKNKLLSVYAERKRSADHWADRIKSAQGRKKFSAAERRKASVKAWFRGENWDGWATALAVDPVRDSDGQFTLDVGGGKRTNNVDIGESSAWEDRIAVTGFFGEKVEDIAPEDFDLILDNWSSIREKIEAVRNRVRHVEAAKKFPISSDNPQTDLRTEVKLQEQVANSPVGVDGEDASD